MGLTEQDKNDVCLDVEHSELERNKLSSYAVLKQKVIVSFWTSSLIMRINEFYCDNDMVIRIFM